MNQITMRPLDAPRLRTISFGAGVQSTVLLLMACHREVGPMPDAAIFADTGYEPAAVYAHLEWCQAEVARLTNGQLEIHVTSAGNIRDDHLAGLNTTGGRFAAMPLFTEAGGMGRRQCTKEYKVRPIIKKTRELCGVPARARFPKGEVVESWIGISTDEIQRVKAPEPKWLVNRYPLIEAGMSRGDCIEWFRRRYPGQPLAKSACIACPFRDNESWRRMKRDDPASWADACEFDSAIRENGSRLRGMNEQQFVHRSRKPLEEAPLGDEDQDDLFAHECEGMCGV